MSDLLTSLSLQLIAAMLIFYGFARDQRLESEITAGLCDRAVYAGFTEQVRESERNLLSHMIEAKRAGRRIAAYGAAAKGNTLLNYCGIGTDGIDFVVEKNPVKQGRLLPGAGIPVHGPERIFETKPDEPLILPWNYP